MDDSPRVVAALQSENQETSNGYSSNYAALIVRCQERETEVYINVNTFIGSDNGRVRYRLDDQKAQDVTWGISTDFKAFFVRGAIAFAKKLAAGETLVMRFTPYGDSPQEFRFDVRGLRPHLAEIAKACGWKP